MKTVLGKPLLGYLLERLLRARLADKVVVATTINDTDQPVVDYCKSLGVSCFRGSEDDVLSRYYSAAIEQAADVIVRVTGDCPLMDPAIIDATIATYHNAYPKYEYVSNTGDRSFPRGMDVEVFSFKALEEAHKEAKTPYEREHVTPYIYGHPEKYRVTGVSNRWTVDTPEDFELVRRLLEKIYPERPEFSVHDLFAALHDHPELRYINSTIKQKGCCDPSH